MNILAGKIALVTGGASGIGRATADLFAREGAQVVVTGTARMDEAAEAMGPAHSACRAMLRTSSITGSQARTPPSGSKGRSVVTLLWAMRFGIAVPARFLPCAARWSAGQQCREGWITKVSAYR